jgi:retron-type reverse transcriptase
MERVVERGHVTAAVTRVRQTQGSPGVDGMTVDERPRYGVEHGEAIRAQRLAGSYQPKPVRAAAIPKSGGGVRTLGIPSVRDRVIQQRLRQVLQPMIDPTFSAHSHGFRPGRNAHDAVCEAQRYSQDGKRVVMDAARQVAANSRRGWKNSTKLLNTALPMGYYDRRGVPRLAR